MKNIRHPDLDLGPAVILADQPDLEPRDRPRHLAPAADTGAPAGGGVAAAGQAVCAAGRHRAARHRATRKVRRSRHARHRLPRSTRWVGGRFLVWGLGVGLLSVLAVLLVCGPASAATLHGVQAATQSTDPNAELKAVINRATAWIQKIIGTVATFFLTLGGARYMTAGGDPSEVERAKGSFRNAGIGYALVILAPVIQRILQSILGVP